MFVNVCVRAISATFFIELFFFSYPSGTEKLALAKEVVSLFPSLRIQVPFGENEGHVRMFLHYKMNYLAM